MTPNVEYARLPNASVDDLRLELERYALNGIAAQNPGIDIDQVRQERQSSGQAWTARVPPQYVTDTTPGWVWAENRRDAYSKLGPQRTAWGTLIQASPTDGSES